MGRPVALPKFAPDVRKSSDLDSLRWSHSTGPGLFGRAGGLFLSALFDVVIVVVVGVVRVARPSPADLLPSPFREIRTGGARTRTGRPHGLTAWKTAPAPSWLVEFVLGLLSPLSWPAELTMGSLFLFLSQRLQAFCGLCGLLG